MDSIFAVAKELTAIRYTHKGRPLDQKTATDETRLKKKMNALIIANQCHLCFSFSDANELLLTQDPKRAFYASEAHKNFYAHFLLRKKVSYQDTYDRRRRHFAQKAPFTKIVKAAHEIQNIRLSGRAFPASPFGWLFYLAASNDIDYQKDDFYRYTESFKAAYPKPKSRLQE